MPVLLDLPAMFAAGSGLAWASRKHIRDHGLRGESRIVNTATGFGIFYGLSVAFLCFWREAWMWHYLFLPPLPTILWYLLFWGALATAAWGGAHLTQTALRTNRPQRARLWLFGSLGLLAILAAVFSDRYLHVGTLADYHRGEAALLVDTPNTLRVIALGGAINIVVLLGLMLWNRWLDRRSADGSRAAQIDTKAERKGAGGAASGDDGAAKVYAASTRRRTLRPGSRPLPDSTEAPVIPADRRAWRQGIPPPSETK